MKLLLPLLCLLMTGLCPVFSQQELNLESAFDSSIDTLEGMMAVVNDLKDTVTKLAHQTMAQQTFVEERIRSDGNSGIKQTRSMSHGTSSYFDTTHISRGAMAIHDHSNFRDTLGMGETIVVMNGVDFRTRHNDYKLNMKSTTDDTYRATEPVPLPGVPPEVSNKATVKEQIAEMKEWFKAFATQNYTVRDYRPYFRPAMCYMEGFWTVDQPFDDPFQSDRHTLYAETWEELLQQIRYTASTGAKHLGENFAYLPSTIVSINETTGKPIYGQWLYRILCHPFSGDIPTSYFRQQDDLAYRESVGRKMSETNQGRAGRYRLLEFDDERFTDFTLLDKIMGEIPGLDNIPPFLNEVPMNLDLYSQEFSNYTKLNTGYYHRMMKTTTAGAMGLRNVMRGFSDEMLFVAETTKEQVAAFWFKYCPKGGPRRVCLTRSSRFSYAIPLEVFYMTPLLTWNPYDVNEWEEPSFVTKGGRRGKFSARLAYNGTCPQIYHYITPAEFYSSTKSDEEDPADTVAGVVGVLDKQGVVRKTVDAGPRIFTAPIEDIGALRMRYPIPPIHGEGSTIWKEVTVLKKKIVEAKDALSDVYYHIALRPTTVTGLHEHDFYLTVAEYAQVDSGNVVTVTTSLANGHQHELEVWMNPDSGTLEYKTCGGANRCWDKHPKDLIIESGPGIETEL